MVHIAWYQSLGKKQNKTAFWAFDVNHMFSGNHTVQISILLPSTFQLLAGFADLFSSFV